MALVEVCGTKTYGKCMAAIFKLLEAQEQRENITSAVVVDRYRPCVHIML